MLNAPCRPWFAVCLVLVILLRPVVIMADDEPARQAEMAGYLLVPHDKVPKTYNAGFSMYVAAWPLLKHYPGQEFQSGLFGTWMFAQYEGQAPKNHYSDIEGGLGWWRDTRFATETPKFIMGGVALNFSEWANGPGAGKGRDWKSSQGPLRGGPTQSRGCSGPRTASTSSRARAESSSGTATCRCRSRRPSRRPRERTFRPGTTAGPCSSTPATSRGRWHSSRRISGRVPPSITRRLSGLFLDTRPSEPNKALQMETQHIPAYLARDAKGDTYARIAPTLFPGKPDGDSVLVHRITAYSKAALWDGVKAWFDGGQAVSGAIDPKAASVHTFDGKGGATWQIYPPDTARDKKVPLAWSSFAIPSHSMTPHTVTGGPKTW